MRGGRELNVDVKLILMRTELVRNISAIAGKLKEFFQSWSRGYWVVPDP